MERLISMTDFVLEQKELMKESEQGFNIEKYDFIINTCNYANFLKQPLNLSMFVPCKLVEGVWVVLEEPIFTTDIAITELSKVKEYQEAKDRVLFEGFEYVEEDEELFLVFNKNESLKIINNENFVLYDGAVYVHQVIEDLVKYNLELTPAAKKQIGL